MRDLNQEAVRPVLNLLTFQHEVGEWSRKNFGNQPSTNPLLGVGEEVGELFHAHLKNLQGIRMSPAEARAKKEDAIGDILVYLADYCEREAISLEAAAYTAWDGVRRRNWVENPRDAHLKAEAPQFREPDDRAKRLER
ncbi:MAG: hypothetical protein AB7V18_19230 [Pyrinomonadaceae bacterium]